MFHEIRIPGRMIYENCRAAAYRGGYPEASRSGWTVAKRGLQKSRGRRGQVPREIALRYPRASILPGGHRVVFRIKGNRYRLIAIVEFVGGIVGVRWIGTHAEYDRIDANTV